MKDKGTQESTGDRLTPIDIQQKEFRISRFRGYKEREVDEFLDRLTEDWGALLAEHESLRAAESSAGLGAPDLDDVARQADEIIARAREEAERLVRQAQDRAEVLAAPPSDADDRAAISAFLRKERAFLQELAQLVQDHAEGLKGMARDAYAKPATSAAVEQPTPHEPARATGEAKAREVTSEGFEEPIRVEEPEPAALGRSDDEEQSSEGDRSLRDLFWGEE